MTFAATSQTEEEAKRAKQGHADGSKPVKVPKRVWRPKVRSEYIEPEDLPDTSEGLDWLFEDCGRSIIKNKQELPPRDDLIRYDEKIHQEELESNLQERAL